MSKIYLITGGAGFLGINLTRYLLEKGNKVRSLDIAPFAYAEKGKVDVLTGDIREKAVVQEAAKGCHVIVHAAAALPLYSKKDIYSTEVDGTRNVLEAALVQGVEKVIHISSTAVYGVPEHHPITEEDELVGVGPYGEAKIEAEKLCSEYRNRGLCVSVLRPKSFIGPERLGVFAILYEWAKEGRNFPIIGSGKNVYQLLDVEDLCAAIYQASVLEQEKMNDVFNIGAKNFNTLREDFQAVLDTAGYGKKIIPFPAAPAILLMRFFELFRISPLYRWVYETVYRDSYVSIEKAEKFLGFTPKYSNREALIRNYQWYLDNLSTLDTTPGISHRAPWKQGILKVIKLFF